MIQVCIQVAGDSRERRIYNEQTLEFLETRQARLPYPYPYGFVLGTIAEDGDCLDCYLLTHDPLPGGSIVNCEPVGLLEQHENDEIDHKILAVLPGQPITVDPASLDELCKFIQAIFAPQAEIDLRVGPLHPREAALRHLEVCRRQDKPG